MVWTVLLKAVCLISFSKSANIMGAGKPHNREYKPIKKVFLNRREANGLVKNILKYRNPTQGLPIIPFAAL